MEEGNGKGAGGRDGKETVEGERRNRKSSMDGDFQVCSPFQAILFAHKIEFKNPTMAVGRFTALRLPESRHYELPGGLGRPVRPRAEAAVCSSQGSASRHSEVHRCQC